MKKLMMMAMILAIGSAPVLAKTTYCQDPVTHKRVSCKTISKTEMPASPAATMPEASSPMAAPETHHKGKKCGNSYIAQDKVCHKS